MGLNSSGASAYLNKIREQHRRLIEYMNTLVLQIGTEDRKSKIDAAILVLKNAQSLKEILSQPEIPTWLDRIIPLLSSFSNSSIQPGVFLTSLIPLKGEMDSHEWRFEESYNFDAIFFKYRDGGNLPKLFDEVIKIIEDIIKSDEIDSKSILNSLEKLIATLKASKKGSYFSLQAAFRFLTIFVQEYLWAELEKIPLLGSFMSPLKKAIEDIDYEMAQLHEDINKDIVNSLPNNIKGVKTKAINILSYDRNACLSPAIAEVGLDTQV